MIRSSIQPGLWFCKIQVRTPIQDNGNNTQDSETVDEDEVTEMLNNCLARLNMHDLRSRQTKGSANGGQWCIRKRALQATVGNGAESVQLKDLGGKVKGISVQQNSMNKRRMSASMRG